MREAGIAKACDRFTAALTEVQCELVHLVVPWTVSVPEPGAFINRERNLPGRARIRTNDQHIGLAIADSELATRAVAAQMGAAHRRAVFDLQFAHGDAFLIRRCRKVPVREKRARSVVL